jgi:hypothetical protein
VKTKAALLSEQRLALSKGATRAFRSLSGVGMSRCARYIKRGSWLSLQYFELGSLINLYRKALEVKDPKIRKGKLELFVKTALRILRGYKFSTYRRFRKNISKSARGALSLTSLHDSMSDVYEELKAVARSYERRRRWKAVLSEAESLFRETFGR